MATKKQKPNVSLYVGKIGKPTRYLKETLEDRKDLKGLRAQIRDIDKQIAALEKKRSELVTRENDAERIIAVVEDVPLNDKTSELRTSGYWVSTIPDPGYRGLPSRRARTFKLGDRYAVDIQEHAYNAGNRWRIPVSLGNTANWTAKQAQQVAIRWLVDGTFDLEVSDLVPEGHQ